MNELLKPVRGLQVVWRGVYEVDPPATPTPSRVDFFDFAERINLYRDGAQAPRIDTKRSPRGSRPSAAP